MSDKPQPHIDKHGVPLCVLRCYLAQLMRCGDETRIICAHSQGPEHDVFPGRDVCYPAVVELAKRKPDGVQ